MNATLLGLAISFMLVAIGVFIRQRRAKSCPLHRRWAGRLAVATGLLCALASVALFVAAWGAPAPSELVPSETDGASVRSTPTP